MVCQERALRRDIRRVVTSISQRDRHIEGIVDEELGVELWYDVCALRGLMCSTGGDTDRRREL